MSTANKRTLGVNDHALRSAEKIAKHRDHDPQALLTQEVIRERIASGMCSWCDRGPFKSLASHTNASHGIDRRELRALAGLSMNEPVASQEFIEACRERAISDGLGHRASAKTGRAKARRADRRYSDAGRMRIAETTRKWMADVPATERSRRAQVASKSRTPEGLRRTGEAAANRVKSEEEIEAFRERMWSAEMVAKRNALAAEKRKPCGTVASYKRGCRCDPCRTAKRLYRRELKTRGAE